MKIYTKTGDRGETGLFSGRRVKKNSQRIVAYGTIDELNSVLGVLCEKIVTQQSQRLREMAARLVIAQESLFSLGSELACDGKVPADMHLVNDEHIRDLELDMDAWDKNLAPLRQFVLPGGSETNATAHLGRTTCRRAERELVELNDAEPVRAECLRYLNRLSDWLFVASRVISAELGTPERLWQSRRPKAAPIEAATLK